MKTTIASLVFVVVSFNEVYIKSVCQPRETLVDIFQYHPEDTQHTYVPSCVVIKRCGGFCNDEALECVATESRNVTLQVSAASQAHLGLLDGACSPTFLSMKSSCTHHPKLGRTPKLPVRHYKSVFRLCFGMSGMSGAAIESEGAQNGSSKMLSKKQPEGHLAPRSHLTTLSHCRLHTEMLFRPFERLLCLLVFKVMRVQPRVSQNVIDLSFTEHLKCECR